MRRPNSPEGPASPATFLCPGRQGPIGLLASVFPLHKKSSPLPPRCELFLRRQFSRCPITAVYGLPSLTVAACLFPYACHADMQLDGAPVNLGKFIDVRCGGASSSVCPSLVSLRSVRQSVQYVLCPYRSQAVECHHSCKYITGYSKDSGLINRPIRPTNMRPA